MIPSYSSSPGNRRGSLFTQIDFDNIGQIESQQFVFQGPNGENLQIVPDIESINHADDAGHTGLEKYITDLHVNWPRISVNMISSQQEFNEYPRSPFLPKTSISEIDNMALLSPLFSISDSSSPVIKTPSTLYEICCSTRKPSDDLSIYLPDNFTPASLESLDKCINRTVFQFPPTVSRSCDENVFENCAQVSSTSDFREGVGSPSRLSNDQRTDSCEDKTLNVGVSVDSSKDIKKLDDISSVREKRARKKRKNTETKNHLPKRWKINSFRDKDTSPLLRNKMERDRRNDLNNRFQKLRDSLPDDVGKGNVSKVSILRAATSYVEDLVTRERELDEISRTEKIRNEELLKKLININQNINKS